MLGIGPTILLDITVSELIPTVERTTEAVESTAEPSEPMVVVGLELSVEVE